MDDPYFNHLFEDENPRKEEVERERKQVDRDLEKVIGTPEGRRTLLWIMKESGVFREQFTGNSATFFNLGRSEFGRKLLRRCVRLDHKFFPQAVNEMFEEKETWQKKS